MTDDLVKRLRRQCRWSGKGKTYEEPCGKCELCEAATEIERLRTLVHGEEEEVEEEVKLWVRCREPFQDRETGDRRAPGDEWETSHSRARKLAKRLVTIITEPGGHPVLGLEGDPWSVTDGRDLRTVMLDRPVGWRVVACLNVWQDLRALQMTMPTWYDHVDHVIAVDGAYAGAPAEQCASTDGTVEYLEGLDKVKLIRAPKDGFWPSQVEKRNAYTKKLDPGDLAFVVDADEYITGAECLRQLGPLDVGWVQYRKDIYAKTQNFPRLFNGAILPHYQGRHYWVEGDRGPVTDCQVGGPGYDHVFVPIMVNNTRGRSIRSKARNAAKTVVQASQLEREAKVGDAPQMGRESLRIVQLASLDAGMVVFRLHTALNSTTPHTSIMATRPHERPWGAPRQYDLQEDRDLLRIALTSCDVVHVHLTYRVLDQLGVNITAPVVMHHHGTMYRGSPDRRNDQDKKRANVILVSNPELLQYGDNLHYLPNPVPVARYQALRKALYAPDPDGYLRVGHSPSKRALKGTEDFLEAVEKLRKLGLKIRPVLIEDMPHRKCLEMKARYCDAFFDSFWLGLQCSGLEAGAMGIPVIAGDEDVKAYHEGEPPYLYANDGEELEHRLEQVYNHSSWTDPNIAGWGDWLYTYVVRNHDYAAVTSKYLDILDERLAWRRKLSLRRGSPFLTR